LPGTEHWIDSIVAWDKEIPRAYTNGLVDAIRHIGMAAAVSNLQCFCDRYGRCVHQSSQLRCQRAIGILL
ncbi:MAG: hypothetical protein ACKN85_00225, partial [Pirellula sp.]